MGYEMSSVASCYPGGENEIMIGASAKKADMTSLILPCAGFYERTDEFPYKFELEIEKQHVSCQ